tara:strand:+ start:4588 stop:5349 length:762 start_codon:yes stop_codon:yes gene_type:complete
MRDIIDHQTVPTNLNYLPIFHSCDSLFFKKIITERCIKVRDCKIFDEKLSYFFYGKPAYKSREVNSKLSSFLPTSFILDLDNLDSLKRMAPFDTGAFADNLFDRYMHPAMTIYDFLLTPKKETLLKLVSFFYGNNENYLKAKLKPSFTCDSMEFEVESYKSMIIETAISTSDERKTSIEIQSVKDVSIESGILKAIILPSSFLASPNIESLMKEVEFEILPYEDFGQLSNNHYNDVFRLTREYFENNSFIPRK